jgi:hypothetical protein
MRIGQRNPLNCFETIIVLTLLSVAGGPATAADESQEPPLQFEVIIGDKSFAVTEGESAQAIGEFNDPIISVTPQPLRVFPYQGISFSYPRSFTFEADLKDPDNKSWTLSGNDFKIIYFVMNVRLSTGEFANSMIDLMGHRQAKVTNPNAQMTLGKHALSGKTLELTLASHKSTMDIYRLPSAKRVTRFLVFQDSLDAQGNRSREGTQALKELASSFSVQE